MTSYPHQCLAKTQNSLRCSRKTQIDCYFCHQHQKIYNSFLKESNRQSGGNPLMTLQNKILSFMVPSCLDILQCDWITDITYVIPGLSSLTKLMSF